MVKIITTLIFVSVMLAMTGSAQPIGIASPFNLDVTDASKVGMPNTIDVSTGTTFFHLTLSNTVDTKYTFTPSIIGPHDLNGNPIFGPAASISITPAVLSVINPNPSPGTLFLNAFSITIPLSAPDGALYTFTIGGKGVNKPYDTASVSRTVKVLNPITGWKCYKIERKVDLLTQFGFEPGVEVDDTGEFLCAPALVNDAGNASQQLQNLTNLEKNNSHLKFYGIDAPPINVTVNLSSQFGNERVTVTKPVFLGLPVNKSIPPTDPSEPLNDPHYKCYIIEPRSSVNREVFLRTQFGVEDVIVNESRFLCAPALKNPMGNASQRAQNLSLLQQKFPHLKLYTIYPNIEIFPPSPPQNFPLNLRTQFGTELNVNITRPLYLAVPVTKVCPITNISLNTGQGISFLDPHWALTAPPFAVQSNARIVIPPHWPGPWGIPLTGSRWISWRTSANSNGTNDYKYVFNFNLSCFSNASLNLTGMSDNQGTVYLNNNPIGIIPSFAVPSPPISDSSLLHPSHFNVGQNQLMVFVHDDGIGSLSGLTGLDLKGMVTAS